MVLDKEEPLNTSDRYADLEVHPAPDGKFTYSFVLSHMMEGRTLQPGEYFLNVVFIPKNDQREGYKIYFPVKEQGK